MTDDKFSMIQFSIVSTVETRPKAEKRQVKRTVPGRIFPQLPQSRNREP
jgi:hypothetical protein